MKKSDALKQERHALNEKQQALIDLAKSEKRDFTETEEADFDARVGEIRALDKKIERALEIEATELRTAASNGKPVTTDVVDGEQRELEKMKKRYSIHNVIRSQMDNGEPLKGVELEIHQETKKQAARAGVAIGGVAVPLASRADGQTVGEDSGAPVSPDYGPVGNHFNGEVKGVQLSIAEGEIFNHSISLIMER